MTLVTNYNLQSLGIGNLLYERADSFLLPHDSLGETGRGSHD